MKKKVMTSLNVHRSQRAHNLVA